MRVQFRKFNKNNEVIAILPDLKANRNYYMSYLHIGQHGECSKDLHRSTTIAAESEYKELLKELIFIGYTDLKVVKRINNINHNKVKL